MTTGFIDAASISQIVQCLDRGYENQYPWSLKTAIDLTVLLIKTDHQHIAPTMSQRGGPVLDYQDRLIDRLFSRQIIKSLSSLDNDTVKQTEKEVQTWAEDQQNLKILRAALKKLFNDQENFQQWIDWVVSRTAWYAHAVRHAGLFETNLIPHIKHVLRISQKAVEELYKESCDVEHLRTLARKRNKEFDLMCKAYMLSALLRGKFHEKVAQSNSLQIMHHPFRELICQEGTQEGITFQVSKPSQMLASFILNGATHQKKLNDRIDCWVENIHRVRSLLATKRVHLDETPTDHAAFDVARDVAKKATIEMGDKRIHTFLDICSGLAIGTLTSIYLDPFAGIPAGALASAGLNKLKVYSKATNWFHLRGL
jgi:hypothetical protein